MKNLKSITECINILIELMYKFESNLLEITEYNKLENINVFCAGLHEDIINFIMYEDSRIFESDFIKVIISNFYNELQVYYKLNLLSKHNLCLVMDIISITDTDNYNFKIKAKDFLNDYFSSCNIEYKEKNNYTSYEVQKIIRFYNEYNQ